MAAGADNGGGSNAGVIGIYAAVVYDVISATNSSPQTTEINATARAATLMKWVKLGLLQAGLFVLIGVAAEKPGKRWRPIVGGGLAMVLLWLQYAHAVVAGCENPGAPTEHYGPPPEAQVRGHLGRNRGWAKV